MALSINDFKVYMPAKDFEQSKRFYTALGFAMSEGWGGTAEFELNGHRFRLQNYYVKDWACNFMVVMSVDDVDAWHRHVRKIWDSGEFENIRIKPPETIDGSLVLHVVDPSGVLLVFVQRVVRPSGDEGVEIARRAMATAPGDAMGHRAPTAASRPHVTPMLDETIAIDGNRYRITWYDPPFLPPREETTQALGICFTADRQIVLITLDGEEWSLPGGTCEPGETLEETLAREVHEEACARVVGSRYIGCQLVEELDGDRTAYYQTRFWARVELDAFTPNHETTARRLVLPQGFRDTLWWGGEATAGLILERGLAIEDA